jgi:hypothetical protein
MRPRKRLTQGDGTRSWANGSCENRRFDDASLVTANETRISQLRSALNATAAAGDLAAYQQHQAEYIKALSARSPEQVHRLNAQHLAAVEFAAALGDHGLRYVPAAWLETDTGRAVAWRTSRPGADNGGCAERGMMKLATARAGFNASTATNSQQRDERHVAIGDAK